MLNSSLRLFFIVEELTDREEHSNCIEPHPDTL
jgi:hypothetical protein